jgi:hypothetical protein
MAKQKGHKVSAAAARATKDRQFKAPQQEMGILSDRDEKDGDEVELHPRTPQKAATWRLVEQSLQQREGEAPEKQATQVNPDPSSLVLISTLPPQSISLVAHSSGLVGQDARSVKLLYLLPHLAPRTSNPLPAGQKAVIRMGIWCHASCFPSRCWTRISWQWRGQAWPHGILLYCRLG